MGEESIQWQEVAAVLLRHKKLIGTVLVVGVVLTALWTWFRSPEYRAAATLMVTSTRAHLTVSPDATDKPRVEPVTEQDLNSEVALLKSKSLIREVLEPRFATIPPVSTGLAAIVRSIFELPSMVYRRMHNIPPPTRLDKLVERTAKDVTVTAIPKSDLVEVSYIAEAPEWTADFVNELVSRHVERHAQLDHQTNAQRFFASQHELLAQEVEAAEKAIREFATREGLDSVEERAALTKRIAELQTTLATSETALAEGNARVAFLDSELRDHPNRMSPDGKAASDPLQLLRSRIVELELQRNQALSQYLPTSIKVQQLDSQLTEAKRLLASELKNPASNTGNVPLEIDLAQTRAQMAALKARIDSVRKQIIKESAKLEHLDQIGPEQDRLTQRLTNAKAALATYVKKEEEARFSNALDESHIVNVAIAEPARVPTAPMPARPLLYIALAALASLLLGGGLAYVRDRMDPTVKSAAEVEAATRLPVLAEIPS